MRHVLSFLLASLFVTACSADVPDEATVAQEGELGQVFIGADDRGALPLEARTIHYAEDARPFEAASFGTSQTAGGSRYVAYHFDAKKGDGLSSRRMR
ncbi:MAG: hypothetical protein U0270_16680 [Labilithrix sp.]